MDEAPLTELESTFAGWVTEALDLRHQEDRAMPSLGDEPQVVLDSLIEVRGRIDRIEGILASVERASGRVDRMLAVATFTRETAWNQALVAHRRGPGRGSGDGFQGPRERYADADLATLRERRDEHQMDVLSRSAKTSVSVVRQCLRGLNGVREDHLAILRAMNIGTRLET